MEGENTLHSLYRPVRWIVTHTSSVVGLSDEVCFQQSYMRSIIAGKACSAFPSLTSGRSPWITALFSSWVVLRFSNGRCPVSRSKSIMA